MASKITIRDIAKHCGVSAATVSRVLSGSGYPVRNSVREQVWIAAKTLGYDYDASRHSVQFKEVAVLVPTTVNPFYTAIINGVERAVTQEGINVLIYNMETGISKGQRGLIVEHLLKKAPCGVVVAASNNQPLLDEGALEMMGQGMKVVLVDAPSPDSRYNCVSYDYRRGANIGTEHLVEHGHRRIVYAGLCLDRESRVLRVEGFKEAMGRNGLETGGQSLLLPVGDEFDEASQIEAGESLGYRVLTQSPLATAVVAMNDLVAIGLMRGFNKRGVRVPEDISVIGFDDSILSEMSFPALTTVRVQAAQMGQMAAMLLLEDMRNDGKHTPINLFLEPQVIERGTVATV